MRTICEACERGDHEFCTDIPDLEREMRFRDCRCLHDPALVSNEARITALYAAGMAAWARRDHEAAGNAFEQGLFLMQPWRAVAAARRPIRKLSLVRKGPTTAECYAKASGEPIEPWMEVKR